LEDFFRSNYRGDDIIFFGSGGWFVVSLVTEICHTVAKKSGGKMKKFAIQSANSSKK
jgi:hypothetical protein